MLAFLILAFVTAQRLSELVIARRNTAALIEAGGVEYGAAHYPYMVAIHTVWVVGLWLLAPFQPVDMAWLLVYVALQFLRLWVLLTLGRRWTTRVIIVPGEKLVGRGPYRFISHPNYVVVVGEIAVLPLVFGLNWFALVFSLLNAVILTIRLSVESAALGQVQTSETGQ